MHIKTLIAIGLAVLKNNIMRDGNYQIRACLIVQKWFEDLRTGDLNAQVNK